LDKTRIFFDRLFSHLQNNDVGDVFVLGDLMNDRREINILVYNTVFEILERFEELYKDKGIKCIYVLGNHDLYYKNTVAVNSLRPVLSKFKHTVFSEEPFFYNKKAIIPWVMQENAERVSKFIKEASLVGCDTLFGHFSFSDVVPYGGKDHIQFSEISKFREVLSGHYHIRKKYGNFSYVGSILDFCWSEENSPHGFAELHNDGKLEYFDNDNSLHKKVYVYGSSDMSEAEVNSGEAFVKVVLMKGFQSTKSEYDKFITSLESKCYDVQVVSENSNFIEEGEENNTDCEIESKSFDEFLRDFFSTKQLPPGINREVIIKLFLSLSELSDRRENN